MGGVAKSALICVGGGALGAAYGAPAGGVGAIPGAIGGCAVALLLTAEGGCGGEEGASVPVQHGGSSTEQKPNVNVEDEAGNILELSGDPPSVYQEFEVPGLIDTLFPYPDGCYAVTSVSGTFIDPASKRLVRASTDGATIVADLATDRNYGPGEFLTGESVALAYQSSDMPEWGQDGLAHGVFVFNEGGNLEADYDLRALGLTRPSALLELDLNHNRKVFVLTNNGTSDRRVTFGDSSLVEIERPGNPASPISVIGLPGYKNAGAMAHYDGNLVIAASDSLEETGEPTRFIVVDPETGEILHKNIDPELPQGLGTNGNAPVSERGILFVGATADGRSLAVVSGVAGVVGLISLPDEIASTQVTTGRYAGREMHTFVSGAEFTSSGSGIIYALTRTVMNASGTPELRGEIYFNHDAEPIDSTPAQFVVGPVSFAPGKTCEAISGSGIDDEGNETSTIRLREKK
ncbi:MAG: hypothetical protein Q7T11_06860 [Deltaproteobacteria bacterium]|nr:hypothetical protein [Deltaproteobacteria bacterium]